MVAQKYLPQHEDYAAFVLQTDAVVDFHHMGTDDGDVDRETLRDISCSARVGV
jgi:hypothetical protein